MTSFLESIDSFELEKTIPKEHIYDKAVPVLPSSMLTEVGLYCSLRYGTRIQLFAGHICFHEPDDPGYPLLDSGLREFSLKENHLSIGVTACFIAVAHEKMQE